MDKVSLGKINPTHPIVESTPHCRIQNSESECILHAKIAAGAVICRFFHFSGARDLVDRQDVVRGASKSWYAQGKFIFGRVRKKTEFLSCAKSKFGFRRLLKAT